MAERIIVDAQLLSANIDAPDIDGGNIDGATIATSDITVGTGKTLNVSDGTLTLANDQISGDKIQGGTIASTTITTLTSTNVQAAALKANDGTASATIAYSTGVMTIGSSVLTTTDINGCSIDGAVICANSAVDGTFAALAASSGAFTGDVSILDDQNNADATLKLGTGANEALEVRALNADGSKELSEVVFQSKTASNTAHMGKMTFKVDEAQVFQLDDSGANGVVGATTPAAGTFTALTANDSLAVNANAVITGDAAGEIQLKVVAHASQSADIFGVELQDGTDKLTVSAAGVTTAASLVATTADIDGGTIDGATIATSDVTVGTGKTLNVSGGTLTTSAGQDLAIVKSGIGGMDADVDFGGFDVRAQTLTADSLSAGLIVYTGTDGVLSAESGFAYDASENMLEVPMITTQLVSIDPNNRNMEADELAGTNGVLFHVDSATLTDAGTSANATATARVAFHKLEAPTLAASNASVTHSDVVTLDVAKPLAGSNVTFGTNAAWAAKFGGGVFFAPGTAKGDGQQGLVLQSDHNSNGQGDKPFHINYRARVSGGSYYNGGFMLFEHDGTNDDQKTRWMVKVNDGDDGEAPSKYLALDSDGKLGNGTWSITAAGVAQGLSVSADGFSSAAPSSGGAGLQAGSGSNPQTVTHSLGSQILIQQVVDDQGQIVDVPITISNDNSVSVDLSNAPAGDRRYQYIAIAVA